MNPYGQNPAVYPIPPTDAADLLAAGASTSMGEIYQTNPLPDPRTLPMGFFSFTGVFDTAAPAQRMNDMPDRRERAAVARLLDGRIARIGGTKSGISGGTVIRVWDPVTDTWDPTVWTLPETSYRFYSAFDVLNQCNLQVTDDGFVFIIGGNSNDNTMNQATWLFRPDVGVVSGPSITNDNCMYLSKSVKDKNGDIHYLSYGYTKFFKLPKDRTGVTTLQSGATQAGQAFYCQPIYIPETHKILLKFYSGLSGGDQYLTYDVASGTWDPTTIDHPGERRQAFDGGDVNCGYGAVGDGKVFVVGGTSAIQDRIDVIDTINRVMIIGYATIPRKLRCVFVRPTENKDEFIIYGEQEDGSGGQGTYTPRIYRFNYATKTVTEAASNAEMLAATDPARAVIYSDGALILMGGRSGYASGAHLHKQSPAYKFTATWTGLTAGTYTYEIYATATGAIVASGAPSGGTSGHQSAYLTSPAAQLAYKSGGMRVFKDGTLYGMSYCRN